MCRGTLTWCWDTNYWLDTEAMAGGIVDVGDMWVARGSNTLITAQPNIGRFFVGWTGDVVSAANPLPLVMNQSYAVTAVFTSFTVTNPVAATTNGVFDYLYVDWIGLGSLGGVDVDLWRGTNMVAILGTNIPAAQTAMTWRASLPWGLIDI